MKIQNISIMKGMRIDKVCICGKLHKFIPMTAENWFDDDYQKLLIGYFWHCDCKNTLFVPVIEIKPKTKKEVKPVKNPLEDKALIDAYIEENEEYLNDFCREQEQTEEPCHKIGGQAFCKHRQKFIYKNQSHFFEFVDEYKKDLEEAEAEHAWESNENR